MTSKICFKKPSLDLLLLQNQSGVYLKQDKLTVANCFTVLLFCIVWDIFHRDEPQSDETRETGGGAPLAIARYNRPRTESPGHNRLNKIGDYVQFLHQ